MRKEEKGTRRSHVSTRTSPRQTTAARYVQAGGARRSGGGTQKRNSEENEGEAG
jgi:hypothetical protein